MPAGIFDRHGTIVDMDTCGAIVLTMDPEERDGLTQQVVDRNKKCCGTKSGHLGHLFESQMVSERQIKELANIEKLEVAEVVLQEAIAQTTEIIYAGWLDDVARRTPEDLTADRSSKDAIITASRIMWSMAATKVIEKEQHHSTSDGWRSATTWNEQETDKCWEEVTSIMTGTMGARMCTVEPIFLRVAAMQSRMRPNAFGWHIPTQRSCHESNRRGTVER